MTAPLPRKRSRVNASAAMVPTTQLIKVANRETFKLLKKARQSSSSCRSRVYQSHVNPVHTTVRRSWLKEKSTSTAIGVYKKR